MADHDAPQTSQEATRRLDIRSGDEDETAKERVRAMNLGGSTSNLGAPVIISDGLHQHYRDHPHLHDQALRENPPIASIPAQDPTPLDEHDYERAARADQVPAKGGPGSVRRVDDRTPDSVLESSSRPYNMDTSAAQRGDVTGQDAAEETAEGKHAPGGARARIAEEARAEQERFDEARAEHERFQEEQAARDEAPVAEGPVPTAPAVAAEPRARGAAKTRPTGG